MKIKKIILPKILNNKKIQKARKCIPLQLKIKIFVIFYQSKIIQPLIHRSRDSSKKKILKIPYLRILKPFLMKICLNFMSLKEKHQKNCTNLKNFKSLLKKNFSFLKFSYSFSKMATLASSLKNQIPKSETSHKVLAVDPQDPSYKFLRQNHFFLNLLINSFKI